MTEKELREAYGADQAVIATLRRRAKCAEDDVRKIRREVKEAFAPLLKIYDLLVLAEQDSVNVPIVTFRRLYSALEELLKDEGGLDE